MPALAATLWSVGAGIRVLLIKPRRFFSDFKTKDQNGNKQQQKSEYTVIAAYIQFLNSDNNGYYNNSNGSLRCICLMSMGSHSLSFYNVCK